MLQSGWHGWTGARCGGSYGREADGADRGRVRARRPRSGTRGGVRSGGGLAHERLDDRRQLVGLRMPLDPEGEAPVGRLDRLGQLVEGRPARDPQARAERVDALVMMGLGPVASRPPAARAASEPGSSRTSWSEPSKVPGVRRWSSWPWESGTCWISVPPVATLSSCMPRQIPSSGRSRSSARRARATSKVSRSGVVPTVCGWGCAPYWAGSMSAPPARIRPSSRSSTASGSRSTAASGGISSARPPARWTAST